MRETIRKWIEECIREETARTGAPNRWGHPLVGFADASDEAFLPLRQAAHPNHRLASEELPGATVAVSWFLPFTRALAEGNRAGELPSRDWSDAYGETNAMARHVNGYLVRRLGEMGVRAAVPQGADRTDPERVMSLWSQRHVAWLAGLGTFGRNNLLIGEQGSCGRYYSVVTTLQVPPDRPLTRENCLFRRGIPCRACLDRCPVQALTDGGFDRFACHRVTEHNAARYGGHDVCGKCAVGLPCSFGVPERG